MIDDEQMLRNMAREAVLTGKLPDRAPDRMYGGPGLGLECTICGGPVAPHESELEIEFRQDAVYRAAERHHVHIRCFSIWDRERHYMRSAANRADAASTPLGGPRLPHAARRIDAANSISDGETARLFLSSEADDGKISRRGVEACKPGAE